MHVRPHGRVTMSHRYQAVHRVGHDLISPSYYILSSPLLSLIISSFQPFSQLYSWVGSVSQAIDGEFSLSTVLAHVIP